MPWNEMRFPESDDAAEDARRARYWAWADARTFSDDAPPLLDLGDGMTWHAVDAFGKADYEAATMRHSVGYNYAYYRTLGEIRALRRDGVPHVTALVTEDGIEHAVRADNAIVTDGDRAYLQAVSDRYGWELPDNASLQGARSPSAGAPEGATL